MAIQRIVFTQKVHENNWLSRETNRYYDINNVIENIFIFQISKPGIEQSKNMKKPTRAKQERFKEELGDAHSHLQSKQYGLFRLPNYPEPVSLPIPGPISLNPCLSPMQPTARRNSVSSI
jgi:hypothetical protein